MSTYAIDTSLPAYRRPVPMPKWNRPVTVDHEPRAFRKLPEFAGWTKAEHLYASETARAAGDAMQDSWQAGVSEARARYGYADPSDWTLEQCREYMDEHGLTVSLASNWRTQDEDEQLNAWRDICREHAQENPAEVYEWWRVSSWLCDQLHAIGEVTIDNDYGHWWGRQCSGQGWIMDGTLQKVAEQFEREP